MNLFTDTHHWSSNQPRLLKHQLYECSTAEIFPSQAQFAEIGTTEVEHLRSGFTLQQILNLSSAKRILEEISLADFNSLLRKKLFRFPACVSLDPAVEIYFFCHFDNSPPSSYYTRIIGHLIHRCKMQSSDVCYRKRAGQSIASSIAV